MARSARYGCASLKNTRCSSHTATPRISAGRSVRRATVADVPRVDALLDAQGIAISTESLRERIDADGSGVVLGERACASYMLDGAALFVYDVAGDFAELPAIVAELDIVSREAFSGVLSATLFSDDPLLEALLACGFECDWEEADVRDGRPAMLVGLVRCEAA